MSFLFAGEKEAHKKGFPTIMIGLFAIFLIVGFFHFHIVGEPTIENVPLFSTIIAAVILVVLWSSLTYRRTIIR